MATENSPQTLFRFVSLRNPNLAETDEKNLRFIFRPSNIEGFFDAISNNENQPKIEALITATSSFPKNAIKSLNDLETGEFSDWMMLNYQQVTEKVHCQEISKLFIKAEVLKHLCFFKIHIK